MLALSRQNRAINPLVVPLESKSDLQNSPMFGSRLNFNILAVSVSTGLSFLGGFVGLMMKSRIKNSTTTQMTKSRLLRFQALK